MPAPIEWIRFKQNQEVGNFLAQLEAIPWFASIGKPIPAWAGVEQVFSWDKWPGPEDPTVSELHSRQHGLYDEIMARSDQQGNSLSELWAAIQAGVVRLASQRVPYDPNKDTWYEPNAAVWHAAWTAGLVGLCLFTGHDIPLELQEQWKWFADGHWPCTYAGELLASKVVVYCGGGSHVRRFFGQGLGTVYQGP